MLQPKKTKHRKVFKGRMKGDSQRGHTIAFGSYALKTLDSHWITARQIEAARVAATRYMKREGQMWIRIFPKNLRKYVWEKVKVMWNIGQQL